MLRGYICMCQETGVEKKRIWGGVFLLGQSGGHSIPSWRPVGDLLSGVCLVGWTKCDPLSSSVSVTWSLWKFKFMAPFQPPEPVSWGPWIWLSHMLKFENHGPSSEVGDGFRNAPWVELCLPRSELDLHHSLPLKTALLLNERPWFYQKLPWPSLYWYRWINRRIR